MKRNGKGKPVKRLAIVDDDPTVLDSLAAGLGRAFDIVAKCRSGNKPLERLASLPVSRRPDIVLLEISFKYGDGFEYCSALRQQFPEAVIAFHTVHALPCFVNGARAADADAYFRKPVEIHDLAAELTRLRRARGLHIDPDVLLGGVTGNLVLRRDPLLSPRMERLLEMEARGRKPKEIAGQLGMELQTVYTQLHRGMERLHTASPSA